MISIIIISISGKSVNSLTGWTRFSMRFVIIYKSVFLIKNKIKCLKFTFDFSDPLDSSRTTAGEFCAYAREHTVSTKLNRLSSKQLRAFLFIELTTIWSPTHFHSVIFFVQWISRKNSFQWDYIAEPSWQIFANHWQFVLLQPNIHRCKNLFLVKALPSKFSSQFFGHCKRNRLLGFCVK